MSDSQEWLADGDLLSVPGWSGAATRCGLKPSGSLDLALLRADEPQVAAAVWTRNALPAAPVVLGKRTLAASPDVRSIVVNAGNANAMTGAEGLRVAEAMQQQTAELCGGPALVLSTGVIGVPLPLDKVQEGIRTAATGLTPRCPEIADAILTTDTCRKTCALEVALPVPGGASETATVGGIAKGSGMIHPNMATMLAVVAVDQRIAPPTLDGVLRRATEASFHEITVDGDTSTNDAVLLLARRDGEQRPIDDDDPRLPALEESITRVLQRLARAIVLDGEGRTRVMELVVHGARDHDDARRIADSIARSSLVKTALAGGDPNWGRILAAAANAGCELDADAMRLEICGERVFDAGLPTDFDAEALGRAFSADEVRVELALGNGPGRARRWTTDLSVEYVRINSEYTT